jgi:hypothetical protein
MAAYRRIVVGTPFPLMGKGRDRGAREPIRTITPTFVPSRGRIRTLSPVGFFIGRPLARPDPIFEGGQEGPKAAEPQPKNGKEYSPQRRRVRRVRSIFNKDSLLGVLRASAVNIRNLLECRARNLRRLRKLSTMVIQRAKERAFRSEANGAVPRPRYFRKVKSQISDCFVIWNLRFDMSQGRPRFASPSLSC